MGLANILQENGTQGLLVLRRQEEMLMGLAGLGRAPGEHPGLLTCSHL